MQFFSPTGLVLGSHSFSSSEQRMSLVTTLRSPHLAVHCKEARVRSIVVHLISGTRPPAPPSHICRCSPLTTQTSPTVAHRPDCGTSCVPPAGQPPWLHRGHCTLSCQSRGTASSSSARCGTDGPRHRCASTRSSCWSPTCLGSGARAALSGAKPDWKEVRPASVDCTRVNPVVANTAWNVRRVSCKCPQPLGTWLPLPMLTASPSLCPFCPLLHVLHIRHPLCSYSTVPEALLALLAAGDCGLLSTTDSS